VTSSAVLSEGAVQLLNVVCKKFNCKEGSIYCTGLANGKSCNGCASRHLHYGIEGIFARKVCCWNRYTQDRNECLCREHSGKVGSASGTSNDRPDSPCLCSFGEREQFVGHAMRREDLRLVRNIEKPKNIDRFRHDYPVTSRAHHHTHKWKENFSHAVSVDESLSTQSEELSHFYFP